MIRVAITTTSANTGRTTEIGSVEIECRCKCHGKAATPPPTPGESYGYTEARRIVMTGSDTKEHFYINNAYRRESDIPKLAVHLDRAHAAGFAAAIEAVAKWLVLHNAVGWATKIRALAKDGKP